jgi:lipoate-protein ligase A
LTQVDCDDRDFVFIYQNRPSVVIGRNQNIYEEVNLPYCHQHNIDVCRRISGGGTVYHDLGNINISWITKRDMHKVNNYTTFINPLINFLQKMQVHAYLNERNSIYVGDKKIGGNAQFSAKKNLLSHCTLLFESDLNQLENAIRPTFREVKSMAGKSVRSTVMNLKERVMPAMDLSSFMEALRHFFTTQGIVIVQLTPFMIGAIQAIHVPKLKHFDWVYGRSPKSEIDCLIGDKAYKLLIEQARLVAIEGEDIPNILSDAIDKKFTVKEQEALFNLF